MKNQTDAEVGQTSQMNVIAFRKNEIPHDVMFPASKNFSEYHSDYHSEYHSEYHSDDPLEDLLSEFDAILNEQTPVSSCDDSRYSISYSDSLSSMADKLARQIKKIKEDSKRLQYYLDEIE